MVEQWEDAEYYHGTKAVPKDKPDTKLSASELKDKVKYTNPDALATDAYKTTDHTVKVKPIGDDVVTK